MLSLLTIAKSRRLRELFDEAGYTEVNLRKYLGAAELPSRHLRNEARLLGRTGEPTLLNALLRWFWLGREEDLESASKMVPAEFLELLLEAGLVQRLGDRLAPQAMLLPVDKFLVASDHSSAIERGASGLVLWPNPTSKFLSRFAVRRHSRATLDLGTGSGILSLEAARFSDKVVATDLNPRVPSFVAFNAQLNGVEDIEMLLGDAFTPVAGRTFDLILCNPPFFITPNLDYMFCENSMELDGLCRRLVKEASAFLNEGGYLEMLCEWAQVNDEPWEHRVAEWLENTGCDAWVMKGVTQYPEEYAQQRVRETTQDTTQDSRLYEGYMAYYRDRGVLAIHDGLIVMRKRTGKNWVRIEEVPKTPSGDLGEMVQATFAAHDLLLALETDESLLAIRPRLVDHSRLEQISAQKGNRWHAESVTLRLTRGFQFHWTLQPLVADFLAGCDGTATAEQLIEAFAEKVKAPLETVRREVLAMLRKLIERGFVVAAPLAGDRSYEKISEP